MQNLRRTHCIASIFGTRPQFIKIASFSRAVSASSLNHSLIDTGQHYSPELSNNFIEDFAIPKPDYSLGVAETAQCLQVAQMLHKLEPIISDRSPNLILVYGDTNSTLAGAIAAKKHNIPLAHVEAGMRSGDLQMQEEINRLMVDSISDYFFTSCTKATENLIKEGKAESQIFQVGDLMLDIYKQSQAYFHKYDSILTTHNLEEENFILCTIHRAENTDNGMRLECIVNALNRLSNSIKIVFPIHPRTKMALQKHKLQLNETICALEPLRYPSMMHLLSKAKLLVTDSGGLQKEAYFSQTQCVTLRDSTEWSELLEVGANTLVSVEDAKNLQDAILNNANSSGAAKNIDLYGSGDSGSKICAILENLIT